MADVLIFAVMLAIYSAIMIYIGYRGYKATKNVQDWLVAGRRIGPVVVAMSLTVRPSSALWPLLASLEKLRLMACNFYGFQFSISSSASSSRSSSSAIARA